MTCMYCDAGEAAHTNGHVARICQPRQIAELERQLAAERAAIVAYLESEARGCTMEGEGHPKWRYYAAALATAADNIKRGEHLEQTSGSTSKE